MGLHTPATWTIGHAVFSFSCALKKIDDSNLKKKEWGIKDNKKKVLSKKTNLENIIDFSPEYW